MSTVPLPALVSRIDVEPPGAGGFTNDSVPEQHAAALRAVPVRVD